MWLWARLINPILCFIVVFILPPPSTTTTRQKSKIKFRKSPGPPNFYIFCSPNNTHLRLHLISPLEWTCGIPALPTIKYKIKLGQSAQLTAKCFNTYKPCGAIAGGGGLLKDDIFTKLITIYNG